MRGLVFVTVGGVAALLALPEAGPWPLESALPGSPKVQAARIEESDQGEVLFLLDWYASAIETGGPEGEDDDTDRTADEILTLLVPASISESLPEAAPLSCAACHQRARDPGPTTVRALNLSPARPLRLKTAQTFQNR